MTSGYKRLSFSNKEEFKLIDFIKKHPALWDASHEEYLNSELRRQYWITLSTELNKTVFECRRKWRFIRDYYIHKRRRQPDSTPQRDGKYYNLQFLNKVKVCSKKFSLRSVEFAQRKIKSSKKLPQNYHDRIEVDFVDSDFETDCDFLDDPTFEKITMERVGNNEKCVTPSNNDGGDDDYLPHQDPDTVNDGKSDDFLFKEEYIDEECAAAGDSAKHQTIEDIDEEVEEHLLIEANNENLTPITVEEENKQADSTTINMLHEKAIDLFFESMAAAVKTFPPQFVAEAKCKVFMAFNEIESKVYRNANKN